MPALSRRAWMKTGLAAAAGVPLVRWPYATPPPRTRRDADGPIRLHSNENPFGPSPAAREAMTASFDLGCRYPGERYDLLRDVIAEREGLTRDHVVLGAGSHDVLRMAAAAYGVCDGEVLMPWPTYEGFGSYAERVGARVHRVPLDADMRVDLDALDRRTTQAIRMVFVCNPNNPTGLPIPSGPLNDFVRSVSRRTPVLVDEAYHEYVTDPAYATAVPLVRNGENVVVSRTFSKIYGLAGLRVGYALARPDIADRLRAQRTNYSVNIAGLYAAHASLQDAEFERYSLAKNEEAKQHLYAALEETGHRYLPSSTNFVFFHLGEPVTDFHGCMMARGLRVGRPFPPYLDWCRLSLSTMDDTTAFTTALRADA